jgi:dihydrofolate synthase/folylpolyglutamate synthase
VAHNVDGIETLVRALAATPPPRPIHGLVSILGDKDWRRMLRLLRPHLDALYLTIPPTAPPNRLWDLETVTKEFGADATVEPAFQQALTAAARGAGTVLVTGSFHTVGDAMARLPGFAPLG